MNKNDVTVFGLVAVMVVAVATAVTARYPDANVGSVADWCAAVGTIFAASTALYIAHHEARRAREVLLEERSNTEAAEKRSAAEVAADRLRADAITVQAAISGLSGGLASCRDVKDMIAKKDAAGRKASAKIFLLSSRFTGPTAILTGLFPAAAHASQTAEFLLQAKSAWGACCTRVELVSQSELTDEQVEIVATFDDVRTVLRDGLILHWKLRNHVSEDELPPEVMADIEAELTDRTW